MVPVLLIGIISYIVGFWGQRHIADKWYEVIIFMAIMTVVNIVIMLLGGLSKKEREAMFQYFKGKFNR
jgi:cell shape-determining protein MreD